LVILLFFAIMSNEKNKKKGEKWEKMEI